MMDLENNISTLEVSLVQALRARFGQKSADTADLVTESECANIDDEIFSYLQSDWERAEISKLQSAFKTTVVTSEDIVDIRENEKKQADIASEYVAGLQEVYMCKPCSISSGGDEREITMENAEEVSVDYSRAIEAPPRFASRLLNDVLFRARISGKTAMPNEFLASGTLLTRAIELLTNQAPDAVSCVKEETVRALIEKWRSTNYLYSTPRLHKVDVVRLYENGKVGGDIPYLSDKEMFSSEIKSFADAKEQTLFRVKKKVAYSERREEKLKRKRSKDAAALVASKSIVDLVLNAVRVDVERFEASRKSQMALEAIDKDDTVAKTSPSNDMESMEATKVIRLSDVPKPSLATLFSAKDPDGTGWMSFSHAMLAFDEAKLFITTTEMYILASSLIKDSERNGSLPWTALLDLIGTSRPSVGGDWSSKSLLNNFQNWETMVQSCLMKIQGFCGPDDVSKLILCQPSVTAQFTKTHMRRYSVALSQHPVLQSSFFLRTSCTLRQQHDTLSTVLRAFDVDLQLAVNSGDVNYALQCVGVKLSKASLEQFCDIFKFPKGRSGREDDVYGDSQCSSKFGVPFPNIDCERMLLSISPGTAILYQDKESDGISNSHFIDCEMDQKSSDKAFDIDATLAMISSKVFVKFLNLRAKLLSLPEPRNASPAEFSDTCASCEVDVDDADIEFLLDFCRSDIDDAKLDAIRFIWILATSTTPASIAYQAPPMQVVEIGRT